MKKIIAFFSFLLVLTLSSQVFAIQTIPAPTISGLTGLIRVPTADILPYKNFNLGIEYGSDLQYTTGSANYKINLGTFRGVEMGITGASIPNTNRIREGVYLNMKLGLSTEDEPYPLKLAIGVENLASYGQADVFMVATKYMSQGPKLTFGFMADFPNDRFRPLGVIGLEWPFLSNHLSILADGMMGETMGQLDLGARIYLTSTFCLHVDGVNVLQDANNPQGKEPKQLIAGFSWANPF